MKTSQPAIRPVIRPIPLPVFPSRKASLDPTISQGDTSALSNALPLESPTEKKDTFVTAANEADCPDPVQQYFSKVSQGFRDLDGGLERCLRQRDSDCLTRYRAFVQLRASQMISTHFRDGLLKKEEEELKATQFESMKHKLQQVETQLAALLETYKVQEREWAKSRSRAQHAEEDNVFLRERAKRHISEARTGRLVLGEICATIESASKTLSIDLSMKADGQSGGKTEDLVREVYTRAKKFAEEKTTLGGLLEELAQRPTGGRRSKSTTPHGVVFGKDKPGKKGAAALIDGRKRLDVSFEAGKMGREDRIMKQMEYLRSQNMALKRQVFLVRSKATLAVCKKNEIEEAFLDSVEEAKRIIFRRRFKTEPGAGGHAIDPKVKTEVSQRVRNTLSKLGKPSPCVKYADFTSEDKLNIVTLFVCNQNVLLHIYRLLFPENAQFPHETHDESVVLAKANPPQDEAIAANKTGVKFSRLSGLSRNQRLSGGAATDLGKYRTVRGRSEVYMPS